MKRHTAPSAPLAPFSPLAPLAPLMVAALALLLAACGTPRKLPGDDQPTLASLTRRNITLPPDTEIRVAEEQTIAAYRQFLAAAPNAPQRADAMRRLGDLEMDRADRASAEGAGSDPDYKAAIARYQEFLKTYPQDARSERVLYQLARAQEQGGDLEGALKTLTRLVQDNPGAQHSAEAQFRRGELLFATRDYKTAETAYEAVLTDSQRGPFHERALYMQGWSRFKQGRLDDALEPFFAVLDLKLGGLDAQARDEADLAELRQLTRADRELVEDTFRVMGITLSNLQGAESVAKFIDGPQARVREVYQFRVYQALGELYIKQDRIKDAADTFALFVRRQPLHAQAPLLQARVIEIYALNGFESLALQAKKDHVVRYGADSEFRRANPGGWQRAQPLVKTHLVELARHHHALSQKTHAAADVQEAAQWYRTLLTSFPDDADAPANRFLLAELLFEDRRWAEAVVEYETVAYRQASDPKSADAGYSALLAYAAQEKETPDAAQRTALQRQSIDSGLRFAKTFIGDMRSGAVLTHAAEQLFALGEADQAVQVARQSLALQPLPAPELRRTAWTVVAHHAFERSEFADAERAYTEVLALTADKAPGRAELAERQAAAIYKQGELARAAGDARAAVGHFERVSALGALAVTSTVRASAQFDAAAALIGLKDWARAASALEDFRRQQPGHPLQAEVAPKLALAYLELGRQAQAAAEFERVAAQAAEPELARAALWQAAELHEKAAQASPEWAAPKSPLRAAAIAGYERFLQKYAEPLEPAVEARWRLAALTRQDGQAAKATAWVRAVQQADAEGAAARTARTRTLGGQATLLLAEPLLDAYRKVPLVEPLAKQLKLKKTRMEDVLRAYATASEVQVAEVTTAATFHTAALYQDFGKALMGSARPKKLNKAEIEQYNVMLEEQAFPFEEKAIELHETNAGRAAAGVFDTWVQKSFGELGKLKPVRYGKVERADATLPADVEPLQIALELSPPAQRAALLLNQLGVAQRRQGQFDKAREAYESAIALDPAAAAPQLNLAILFDLYLGNAARAQALYQRCLELSPLDAPVIGKWIAELKTRKPVPGAPAVPAPSVAVPGTTGGTAGPAPTAATGTPAATAVAATQGTQK
jgi:tetratricopeptide (TPR) repeat protein